jgi:multiple sugar transport system permease protein
LLGNTGAVNTLLGSHVTKLVSQPYAWISIDIATLWWTLGVNMVIMYAAISQIPGTSVEAATLDGASHFGLFRRIVLPQVKPVSLVVIVLATIASFNLFAQSYIMTGGGPGTSTETLSMWIWRTGFDIFNLGSASAMAFVMGVILLAIGIAEYAYIRRGSLR